MVDSFDQKLSLQVMCRSLRNLTVGRQRFVVPLYISCGGKKLPVSIPAKTVVI